MIKIDKKEIVTVYTVNRIEILDGNISMRDRYASFPVKFYDEEGNFFAMNNVEIKNEEYDAWTTDDYIETLILSKLEMTKAIEVEPEVEPEAPSVQDTQTTDGGDTSTDSGNSESNSGSYSPGIDPATPDGF